MTILVQSVPMAVKSFTRADLELSKKYVSADVWPGYYDKKVLSENFPGLVYINRRIINTKDIDFEAIKKLLDELQNNNVQRSLRNSFSSMFSMQVPRANGRGASHLLTWESMDINGYELSHKPISVCKAPSGVLLLLDGRTRFERLMKHEFKNMIVDYYECDNYHSINTFSIFCNPTAPARSPQTMGDVIQLGIDEIAAGRLKSDETSIEQWVQLVTNGSYRNSDIQKLVKSIVKKDSSASMSLSMDEAYDWLATHGYHNNVNNNGIFYFVSSNESRASAIFSAANEMKCLIGEGKKVKEMRIIISPGTLQGAKAEKSWKDKIDQFRMTFENNLNTIKDCYFKDYDLKNIIKLYGAIPTVVSMADKFPLDKLVIFSKMKYSSFAEMTVEENLAAMFSA